MSDEWIIPGCWFDFEDDVWLQDTHVPGHTCMLPAGHDGPHEPTADDDIMISFRPATTESEGV